MKVYNFSPGPSILPQEVFKTAAEGVLNLNNSGLSILEISHRSKDFIAILEQAKSLTKELLSLPDNYHVLFLSGGASTQFLMTAMNFLGDGQKAAYVDTGSWSSKAIKEAKRFGQVDVIASSKDKNYTYLPKNIQPDADHAYLHMTSNNTIFGTQFQGFPDTDVPIVCDMSSDIFSRKIPVEKFGTIYAGAQKNMGPAGTTLVIVREDMIGKSGRDLPTIMNYQTHVDKDSSFNTPPVFPIYVSMLTLQWLKDKGGLDAAEKRNQEKSDTLYAEIDRNGMFQGVVAAEDRSQMNVTFTLVDDSLQGTFIDMCNEAGCVSVKGHRSVGGFRASIYNAMPLEGVQALVEVMKVFENKHG